MARSLTDPADAGRGDPRGSDMCARLGALSVDDFRKVLMKTGLVLVVLGHVSFIAAAILHGTVLRYVVAPHDAVALQYCVVNIVSVTSAIVVISSGIAAIVLSCYLPSTALVCGASWDGAAGLGQPSPSSSWPAGVRLTVKEAGTALGGQA